MYTLFLFLPADTPGLISFHSSHLDIVFSAQVGHRPAAPSSIVRSGHIRQRLENLSLSLEITTCSCDSYTLVKNPFADIEVFINPFGDFFVFCYGGCLETGSSSHGWEMLALLLSYSFTLSKVSGVFSVGSDSRQACGALHACEDGGDWKGRC